jgi:NAD(P)-dependent dehydrogenase (short-subunit alcohol dehydrogenase family)
MSNLFDLTGKTALITGGTGVLGTAMAIGLAEAGANTVILGRRQESGDDLVKSIKAKGSRSMFVKADVLNATDLLAAKEKVIAEFGTFDILVNAAGGNLPGAVIMPEQNFFDLKMD